MVALITLVLTIAVETALACLLLPRERRRLRIDTPLINLATHPLASLAVLSLGASFVLVEGAVIVAEFVAYRLVTRLPPSQAALLALVLNGVTILLSFLLAPLF